MKKAIIATGIILGIVIVAVIVLAKTRNKPTNSTADNDNGTSPPVYPLKYGSRGQEVRELQEALNVFINPPFVFLVVDGIFGAKTQDALKRIVGISSITKGQAEKLKERATVYKNSPFSSTKTLTETDKTTILNS